MTVIHPKPGPKGQKVIIHKPSTPSAAPTWQDAEAVATFVPEGASPPAINGIAVAPITTPRREMDWAGRARSRDFHEPDFEPPSGLKPAAGAVVVEPDGRVWIVHPTNAFGGYQATFPKGTVGKGVGLKETAVREVFEESGLLVELPVIQYFILDADYLAGENLLCILSEGFAALHIKADEVLRMHFQEGLLNWAEGVVPRLQNLFKFAGTVLLGSHTVFYPGKTFHDFGMADDV